MAIHDTRNYSNHQIVQEKNDVVSKTKVSASAMMTKPLNIDAQNEEEHNDHFKKDKNSTNFRKNIKN